MIAIRITKIESCGSAAGATRAPYRGGVTDLHAPWMLRGEAIVVAVRRRSLDVAAVGAAVGEIPAGLGRMPGPIVVLAERFDHSPVGPYISLAFGQPARLGLRPGICFTRMVVNNADRRTAGRLNWGFPGEIGAITWASDADGAVVRWEEGDIELRCTRRSRAGVPMLLPLRSLQHRADGPVVVPARMWGRVHLARTEVAATEGDPLAVLAGTHASVWMAGVRTVVRPARHPAGRLSSLQAPLRAPEPGWSCEAAMAVGPPPALARRR